jgi:acetolactate synthase I/II/III large subunit
LLTNAGGTGVLAEDPEGVKRGDTAIEWGSDAMAELLSRLGLRYIALVPGSSYRGLHDSLVNYGGNRDPRMLVCLHEEHAVAIAHGYAKVTGRPMAVALHANVGLMHAVMAVYNAYCDRVPMLVVGATGPVDAARRRPWIDWIHTSADQGALIRQFCKWDDQPASVEAALDSLALAYSVTVQAPSAPVYVCLDVSLQERPLPAPPVMPDTRRDSSPRSHGPDAEAVRTTLELLGRSRRPLFLLGRLRGGKRDWDRRVALAERYGALVISDLKNGAVFPTRHPLHQNPPGIFLPASSAALIGAADLILSLDWVDLGGTITAAAGHGHPASARIISVTTDSALRNGWSKDSFGLQPADLSVPADPDLLVRALLESGEAAEPAEWPAAPAPLTPLAPPTQPAPSAQPRPDVTADSGILMRDLAGALRGALAGSPACLVRVPLGWDGADLEVDHPLDFLGMDGGAGIGSGPGMAVGAALALEGSGRLPVAVLGDGDFLMGGTAVWTAAHYRLPLLIVVANNSSFHNDVVHAQRMAAQRGRPARNSWIGQAISDPDPDLPAMARSLGWRAAGQVRERAELPAALAAAAAAARSGQCVLVDVRVQTLGSAGGHHAEPGPGGRRTRRRAVRSHPGRDQPRDEHRHRAHSTVRRARCRGRRGRRETGRTRVAVHRPADARRRGARLRRCRGRTRCGTRPARLAGQRQPAARDAQRHRARHRPDQVPGRPGARGARPDHAGNPRPASLHGA